ncbi:MAG: molybdate ABC transporter substrate-binding protein [Lachnospiraceae bacterium]|nr:molybdate ABC transporter substrate-binding protein [Lachnospiraceae bacterium]
MRKGKRRILVLMLLCCSLLMWVTGCSAKQAETKETEKTETATTEPEKEEPEKETTINVFIAASLSNAMEEIQESYIQEHPKVTIVFNSDSSGTLQTQIEEGAECDVFMSAAMKQMNKLNEDGFIVDGSDIKLLKNEVVLIKAKGADTKVTGFENITDAANIAIAGEDVPVGAYSREIIENLGITDKVMVMEINEGATVTAVLTAVAEKSNEIGIVYATDAASMPDSVEIIATAPKGSLKTPVIYPVGLVKNSEADENQSLAAKEFVEYLKTDEAISIFEKYGFLAYKE